MKFLVTAGFDRSRHAAAIIELLGREGHRCVGVLVVSPFQISRLRALLRQRGLGFVRRAVRRLTGHRPKTSADDPFEAWLRAEGIVPGSLRAVARALGAQYARVGSLNDAAAIAFVRNCAPDGVLYAGGGILKQGFLEAAQGRVLNAHSGPLPAIRGMNGVEWSLLLGHAPAVTIHVIERGIDTGGTFEEIPIPVEAGDDIDRLRAKATQLGVIGIVRHAAALAGPLPAPPPAAARAPQCFVLAPALQELLDHRLAQSDEGGPA